ncbi:MAG: HlyC/CorC family transporter [Alphaproteobacteria bacterium]|nr:HlyC/CorC family transporter [Alphaproteobacteria bacterium]
MALLVFYVVLALGVSFTCSIMEAVLLSVTPGYITALDAQNAPAAARLRALKADVDRPLAAILSLNTVAHTIGAAGAGAQVQAIYGEASLAIGSAILTILILVVSEIIPKTLGAVYWRSLAPFVGRALGPLMLLMWPLVKLSEGITRLISPKGGHGAMSREEIEAMADVGRAQGLIDDAESAALKNLLAFGRLSVHDAMTPRTVMLTFPQDHTVLQALEQVPELRFSRIPVYGSRPDHLTGYVLKDQLLLTAARGQSDTRLSELIRPLTMVPQTMKLRELFERLLTSREHVAVALDEYGGVVGLITMEDLLETLLGMEIVDEVDGVEDMRKLAREQWLRRARRLGLVPEGSEQWPPPESGSEG